MSFVNCDGVDLNQGLCTLAKKAKRLQLVD